MPNSFTRQELHDLHGLAFEGAQALRELAVIANVTADLVEKASTDAHDKMDIKSHQSLMAAHTVAAIAIGTAILEFFGDELDPASRAGITRLVENTATSSIEIALGLEGGIVDGGTNAEREADDASIDDFINGIAKSIFGGNATVRNIGDGLYAVEPGVSAEQDAGIHRGYAGR